MKKQTAGRDALGKFAPKFAELNDDVLFGEVWLREDRAPLQPSTRAGRMHGLLFAVATEIYGEGNKRIESN